MRTPAGATKYLIALAALVLLSAGGCAAPTSVGSAAADSAALVATSSSRTQASPASAGTTATASPTGTAGSGELPRPITATRVTAGAGSVVTPLPACKSATLPTMVAGKLTFTTGEKVDAPWFVGSDPANGRGYEAALGAALATELGYLPRDIRWTRSDPSTVLAGRATGFDVALAEFATRDQVGAPVDYTTGYFANPDSVVARTGTAAARVRSLAGLESLRIAATAGSPGLNSAGVPISARLRADYSTASGLAALRSGSVDAVVLPTSTALAAGPWVTVLGQLTRAKEQPPQFGMVLAKNSPLTACVSAAIDELRVTGVLASLVHTWVPAAARPLD